MGTLLKWGDGAFLAVWYCCLNLLWLCLDMYTHAHERLILAWNGFLEEKMSNLLFTFFTWTCFFHLNLLEWKTTCSYNTAFDVHPCKTSLLQFKLQKMCPVNIVTNVCRISCNRVVLKKHFALKTEPLYFSEYVIYANMFFTVVYCVVFWFMSCILLHACLVHVVSSRYLAEAILRKAFVLFILNSP